MLKVEFLSEVWGKAAGCYSSQLMQMKAAKLEFEDESFAKALI